MEKHTPFWKNQYVLLTGIIILAIIFRIVFISKLSIRLDEAQSLLQASFPLHGSRSLFVYMAQDVHPPFFVLMLHFWIQAFKTSAASLRTLSLIFGVCTIPALFALGEEIYNKTTGILVAFIAAISPILIWQSDNARSYALFILLTALSLLFFFRIIHNKGKIAINVLVFILINALGLYTHYFFFFVLLVEGIGALIYRKDRIIVWQSLAFLLFIPWIYFFLIYHGTNSQPHLGAISVFNILLTYLQLIFGYHSPIFYGTVIAFWPAVILIGFIYLNTFKHTRKETQLLVIGAVLPLIAAFAISQVYITVLTTRYVAFTSVFLLLIIARMLLIVRIDTVKKLGIAIFALLLITTSILQMYDPQNTENDDYRDAIAYVTQATTTKDVIVVSSSFTVYPFNYYYKGKTAYIIFPYIDIYNLNGKIRYVPTNNDINTLINSAKLHYTHLYLLESYDQKAPGYTIGLFNKKLHRIGKKTFGYNIEVDAYQLKDNR